MRLASLNFTFQTRVPNIYSLFKSQPRFSAGLCSSLAVFGIAQFKASIPSSHVTISHYSRHPFCSDTSRGFTALNARRLFRLGGIDLWEHLLHKSLSSLLGGKTV
jgi:hypothetical protein